MDRSESPDVVPAVATAPTPPAAATTRTGSQSKISSVLLLVLAAAALFRIVTTVMDRGKEETAVGLIRWTAAQSAAAAAQSAGKPILYDFTAEWCGPCKMLDADGWADAKVAAFVNESFVPARVVDRAREDGRNPPWIDELQRRYGVNAFPTLVVAAPDGRQIAVTQGYSGKERLTEFLEGARGSANLPTGR
jgi:thiol:disulfide interchange protein